MEINTNCEFGYELQLVIPYAYYLYKNNLLNKTTSSFLTRELYYFSKNHKEKYKLRGYNNEWANIYNYLRTVGLWTEDYKSVWLNDLFEALHDEGKDKDCDEHQSLV